MSSRLAPSGTADTASSPDEASLSHYCHATMMHRPHVRTASLPNPAPPATGGVTFQTTVLDARKLQAPPRAQFPSCAFVFTSRMGPMAEAASISQGQMASAETSAEKLIVDAPPPPSVTRGKKIPGNNAAYFCQPDEQPFAIEFIEISPFPPQTRASRTFLARSA